MSSPIQYIVVHRSTKNLPGVLACQTAHAAGEAIRKAPVSSDTRVVALVAEKSEDLEQLSQSLTAAGIHSVLIREPDAPYYGAATALGSEPLSQEILKPYFANFKILR
jgi:hypothetical protein